MKLFSIEDIIELLQQLNEKQVDELEGQHLDLRREREKESVLHCNKL